jgi:hypothetical protein
MRVFNQALLARKAWRLLERPNSLCARLLKAKYYKSGSLLDTVFPVNASPVWKGIEYGLELLKKGVIWRIGNGETVKVWRDPWIPRPPGSRKPLSPRGTCRLQRVEQFLRLDGSWNEDLLNEYMIPVDVEEILNMIVILWLGIWRKRGSLQSGVLTIWVWKKNCGHKVMYPQALGLVEIDLCGRCFGKLKFLKK